MFDLRLIRDDALKLGRRYGMLAISLLLTTGISLLVFTVTAIQHAGDQIKNGAVTTSKLHNKAVTNDKLAHNSVGSGKVKDGSLKASDVKSGTFLPANGKAADSFRLGGLLPAGTEEAG